MAAWSDWLPPFSFQTLKLDLGKAWEILDWNLLLTEMRKPAGKAPLSIESDISRWDWTQWRDMETFQFEHGTTPLADLRTIYIALSAYFLLSAFGRMVLVFYKPLKVRGLSALNGIVMSFVSLVMVVAAAVGMSTRMAELGWHELLCTADPSSDTGLLAWATYAFYLYKFLEFGDTFILVLQQVSRLLM